MSHVAKLKVSLSLLHRLLKLPRDVDVLSVQQTPEDALGSCCTVVLTGERLPDVPEGERVPTITGEYVPSSLTLRLGERVL